MGLITGGTVRNAVPVEASFGGEFRSHNTESIDLLRMQVAETLRKAREKYRDATIKEEIEMMFQMYLLDPNEAIVQLVTNQLRNMSMQPNIHPSGGGTDANAMRLNGVECVVVGMATNEMHTVNEYVVVPDILATAQFCQNILTINQRARA